MLTDHDIEHIAVLARIELSAELHERLKKDLSSILEYADQLSRIDTSGAEPLYQVTGLQNGVRRDEHRGDWPMDEQLARVLIGQAPHQHEGYVQVKTIKHHE